jgi:hypothetical protein
MSLFKLQSVELIEFIQARSMMTHEDRLQTPHPPIGDPKEAVAYWLQIYRQDKPMLLFFGAFSLLYIPISLVYRLVMAVVG